MFKIVRSYLYRPLAQGFIILKIARGQTKREKTNRRDNTIRARKQAGKPSPYKSSRDVCVVARDPILSHHLSVYFYQFYSPPPPSHVIRSHVRANNENNDNTLKLRGGGGGDNTFVQIVIRFGTKELDSK